MFQAFILFLIFYICIKNKNKWQKVPYFLYMTSFLSISPFDFTFQGSSCEKLLLKTTLHHVLCHVYTVKQSCGKIPDESCLKRHGALLWLLLGINFGKNFD